MFNLSPMLTIYIFQSVNTEFTGDSSLTLTVCDWFRPRLIVEFVGGSDGMLRRLAGMAGMLDMVDRWERLGMEGMVGVS